MNYGYPTCRRYPRTLSEAFPAERASAIECHRGVSGVHRFIFCGLAVIAAILLFAHLYLRA